MSARTDVSVYVISAICGNWWTESGINSDVWENLQVGTWTDLLRRGAPARNVGAVRLDDPGDGHDLHGLHDGLP